MKKAIALTFMAFLLTVTCPLSLNAETATLPKAAVKTELTETEIKEMVDRVYEIDRMDKSTLNDAERKALKEELKAIKQELERPGVIIYMSGGFILLLILLIILL